MIDTTVMTREERDRRAGRDVLSYTGLAMSLARRYRGRGESLDDLRQVAMIGLVKASQRFDPSRGVAFSTYATATVDGELKRHFRQRWGLHVHRGDQERYLAVREADEVLTHQLRRRPTVTELSSATGIPPERVEVAMNVGAAFGVESLDRPADARGGHEFADPDDPFARFDAIESLRPLIRAMPARDRDILRLRFGEDLPQTEIARRLGISQMQVSRILARVLKLFREHLSR